MPSFGAEKGRFYLKIYGEADLVVMGDGEENWSATGAGTNPFGSFFTFNSPMTVHDLRWEGGANSVGTADTTIRIRDRTNGVILYSAVIDDLLTSFNDTPNLTIQRNIRWALSLDKPALNTRRTSLIMLLCSV